MKNELTPGLSWSRSVIKRKENEMEERKG